MTYISENQPTPKEESVKPEIKLKKLLDNKKMFFVGFGGLVVIVLIFSVVFGVYRAYAKVSTDRFTETVAKILRLPSVKVNGDVAYYSDYIDDLRAIRTMRDYDRSHGGPAADYTDQELSDQVISRQVDNLLVSELARQDGIKVDASDLSNVKNNILTNEFGSLDKAAAAIKDRYGWSLDVFENKVMVPFILQNKLNDIMKNDQVEREKIHTTAQTVLDEIKKGADFAQMAKEYGSDGTSQKGGDLGWFGKGEMVQPFETAAFALKKGQLSPTLVETQYGYHIIQVMDRKTEKVKDANGKTTDKVTVQARHILFAFPTLQKKLADTLKKASLHIYPKMHNPFEEFLKANSK